MQMSLLGLSEQTLYTGRPSSSPGGWRVRGPGVSLSPCCVDSRPVPVSSGGHASVPVCGDASHAGSEPVLMPSLELDDPSKDAVSKYSRTLRSWRLRTHPKNLGGYISAHDSVQRQKDPQSVMWSRGWWGSVLSYPGMPSYCYEPCL